MNTIILAGCGPGGLDYIPELTKKAVGAADIIAGAPEMLALFPHFLGSRIIFAKKIDSFCAETIAAAQSHRVVVLVSGDPGFHSLARFFMKTAGKERCQIIPAISAVQVAAARLGISWQDAVLSSVHYGAEPDFSAIAASPKTILLLGTDISWLEKLSAFLQGSHTLSVCTDLTLPTEEVRLFSPGTLVLGTRKNILVVNRE